MSYVETSNATSPTLLVTERSRNSTTILSNTTNTVSSENSYCGIVSVIICFCFAVVLMIAIGIWHVRKRQIMKTREGQESIESIETDSLFPPNFMRNCNWTKICTNDYYQNVIQSDLRGYMTRWTDMFEKEYCFGFLFFKPTFTKSNLKNWWYVKCVNHISLIMLCIKNIYYFYECMFSFLDQIKKTRTKPLYSFF